MLKMNEEELEQKIIEVTSHMPGIYRELRPYVFTDDCQTQKRGVVFDVDCTMFFNQSGHHCQAVVALKQEFELLYPGVRMERWVEVYARDVSNPDKLKKPARLVGQRVMVRDDSDTFNDSPQLMNFTNMKFDRDRGYIDLTDSEGKIGLRYLFNPASNTLNLHIMDDKNGTA